MKKSRFREVSGWAEERSNSGGKGLLLATSGHLVLFLSKFHSR